jgi:6-phosphogluconolactonase (cycloisomerase 2 family)
MRILFFIIFIYNCSLQEALFPNFNNKNNTNLGFLSYLGRIRTPVDCINFPSKYEIKKTTSTLVETFTNTCNFNKQTISLNCIYSRLYSDAIETNISSKTDYYPSSSSFIQQKYAPGIANKIYEISNNDPATRKQSIFSANGQLKQIIQMDGTINTSEEYDSKNRVTKGNLKTATGCTIPYEQNFNENTYTFNLKINWSQTTPTTNAVCALVVSLFPNTNIEISYTRDLYPIKRVDTSGSTVTTYEYTIQETNQVCEGGDGTPYSNPVTLPSVLEILPNKGAAEGETITIKGTGLAGTTSIKFNFDKFATPLSVSDTEIKVVVPSGAKSGTLQLINSNGVGSSNYYRVVKYVLYVTNYTSTNNLVGFDLNPVTGALTFNTVLATIGSGNLRAVLPHPNGNVLYTGNDSSINNLSIISLNQNGTLGTTNTFYLSKNGAKYFVFNSDASLLYIGYNSSSSLDSYTINSNGALTHLSSTVVSQHESLSIHPNNKFLYLPTASGSRIELRESTNGNLSTGGNFGTFTPHWITIHPNGNYLYTSTTNEIKRFTIDSTNGNLTGVVNYDSGNLYRELVIHPNSKFFYASLSATNQFRQYTIQPDFSLIYVNTYNPGYNQPWHMVIDPTGKFLYVGYITSNRIYGYTIDPNTGNLTSNGVDINTNINSPYDFQFASIEQRF